MQITWLNAAALAGLALIALPIAIHLLVRQQTRILPYPSLRFLRETTLAAFRRRRIEDALLLACRVAIVATAALAVAGPLLQTPARTAGYAQRTARAHIRVDQAQADMSTVAEGAFRFASFSRAEVADAIRDALRWFEQQPPAAREIVFTGFFARGSIAAADLTAIPPAIGIRFVAVEANPPITTATFPIVTRNGDAVMLTERTVHFASDVTRVTDGKAIAVAPDRATPEILENSERPPLDEPVRLSREQLDALSRPPGPPSATAPLTDEGDRRWLWAFALVLLAVEHLLRRAVARKSVSEQEIRVA